MGALKNWVELQNATHASGAPKYECYFFIADYHALTTDYADTSELRASVQEVALDFLAAGLDPDAEPSPCRARPGACPWPCCWG